MDYVEAMKKVTGKKKVFKAVLNDTTTFVAAGSKSRAAGEAFLEMGGLVELASKPISADDIQSFLIALSEPERNALLKKLTVMNNGKAGPKS